MLAAHLTVAAFIVFGLVAIPLGGALRWPFVHVLWWRLAHLVAMGAVAAQKLMGNACFLTTWEDRLVAVAAQSPHSTPSFQTFGEHVLYWNLPLWFFAALYSLLFAYALALWFVVSPRHGAKSVT